jgi:hypothetical protein
MVSKSVEAGARASLVCLTRSLERMRLFGKFLQTLDSLVGRNKTENVVNDRLDSASEQRYNTAHKTSTELSGLMWLVVLSMARLVFP